MEDSYQLWMSVVSVIQAFSIGWFTYWMKRLTDKIDVLLSKEVEYIDRFADYSTNKKAHEEIYTKLEKIEKRLTVLETKQGII